MTNLERVRRGLANDSACPMCLSSHESILHMLRDCHEVAGAWKSLMSAIFLHCVLELLALLESKGLQLDNAQAAALLNGADVGHRDLPLVRTITCLHDRAWMTGIIWVPREVNLVEDSIAKFFSTINFQTIHYADPPTPLLGSRHLGAPLHQICEWRASP
ncbi:hypothetical protein V6N13_045652 [Hibiscus sabdariffa]|uniref:Reverse transcriptase zinc-binding domain-containing protein n=1 Tax=Hibiscus sabdariffa TaxID=183260 RepID=A0ABR2RLY1_9ROSI